ncbi:60S ribosomal subunit assembly/export protein LOC1 [Plectosphaerella plurivora]|uniref:60S ribosomal subunit assembly/export protein LOC1 n=1 Tax=Plectosphaerella plurivora TaxID=936078 RepID=A0A9P8VCA1_9PEZI|nr:60S ribosomal subunit assembly/export protein LOC1 [Plectosphaerella plurivora]
MAINKTRTVKNKHAGGKFGKHANKKPAPPGPPDGIVRSKAPKGTPPAKNHLKNKVERLMDQRKKNKNRTYSDKELGVPTLNKITPVGVEKPKGKKKGKVFVDDRESMNTILALVQAEKEGQIESKMLKARQLEEIREARRVEAEKKEEEKKAKLEDVKDGLRKKRKRTTSKFAEKEESLNSLTVAGTKATKSKKKVAFA